MLRLATALALVLLVCASARAEPPTDTLRQIFARVDTILTDPATQDRPWERLAAVRKLVNEVFDGRGAAELALGRRWNSATAAEQEEFTRFFADLLERSFLSRLAAQASLDGGTKVQYFDESVDGSATLVRTAVARRNGGEILLDYRMIVRDGRWMARDVIVDGVSVVANYRVQLERVLETSSVPELLAQMRAKAGGLEPSMLTAAAADVPARAAATVDAAHLPEITSTANATAPKGGVTRPVREAGEVTVVAGRAESRTATPATGDRSLRTASSPPRTTKAYWLRIATFKTEKEARRLAARLHESKLVLARERPSATSKASLLTVRMGPFQDAGEAINKLLELQKKGQNPFLIAERW